jgi:hypothetical protein
MAKHIYMKNPPSNYHGWMIKLSSLFSRVIFYCELSSDPVERKLEVKEFLDDSLKALINTEKRKLCFWYPTDGFPESERDNIILNDGDISAFKVDDQTQIKILTEYIYTRMHYQPDIFVVQI